MYIKGCRLQHDPVYLDASFYKSTTLLRQCRKKGVNWDWGAAGENQHAGVSSSDTFSWLNICRICWVVLSFSQNSSRFTSLSPSDASLDTLSEFIGPFKDAVFLLSSAPCSRSKSTWLLNVWAVTFSSIVFDPMCIFWKTKDCNSAILAYKKRNE